MSIEDILKKQQGGEQMNLFRSAVQQKQGVLLKSMVGSQDAVFAASFAKQSEQPHLFVLSDKEEASYFLNNLQSLLGKKDILFFPESFKRPGQINEINATQVSLRSECINRLATSFSSNEIICTYPEALIERVVTKGEVKEHSIQIEVGNEIDLDSMISKLIDHHFEHTDFVYQAGQISIRGGIVDVFSYAHEYPYRIELFDTKVESIRTFDPSTQLSKRKLRSVSIVPNLQTTGKSRSASFLEILPANTMIWTKDAHLFIDKIELAWERIMKIHEEFKDHTDQQENPYLNQPIENSFIRLKDLLYQCKTFFIIEWDKRFFNDAPIDIEFVAAPQPSFNKNFELLFKDLRFNSARGYDSYVLSDNLKQIERLFSIAEDLLKEKIDQSELKWIQLAEAKKEKRKTLAEMSDYEQGEEEEIEEGEDEVEIPTVRTEVHNTSNLQHLFTPILKSIHAGYIDHDLKIILYTDHQIFNRYHRYKVRERFDAGQALMLKMLKELKPGDFITHMDHGIGRYSGLEKIEVNGQMQEAVRIIYLNNDILYVHINSLHKISKYVGKDGVEPKISKLGSDAWANLKRKTKAKIKDIAEDLIKLYAKRKAMSGFAFSKDTYLQTELESSFIYEDTPDQVRATQDIKSDMEKETPMDRLVCGDVGFGKTEVAIRAAFKAVTDSKQVAVLVPTTILAYQHYRTFSERLKELPCKVEFINRFKTAKQKTEIFQQVKEGKIDILIGTHAIVSKQVEFKNLGLMIVDEEQKFGVAVKEKLKAFKVNVDSLTLTATPIPRTLQFSLLGARDLSVIQTPPPNRQPVTTELHVLNPNVIKEAIEQEVYRGGQVFFVHNKVKDLYELKEMIQKIVPNVDIALAHGQLEGEQLEEVIFDFMERKFDVLLSTNIIEAGIDIPNANTIIINNAHWFGLSDLHQLRGRVGRSNKKAFCYLLTPPVSTLTQDARNRLRTIEQFSELGSGFNVAMRDMDIRGAGNLFGGEQSGFISEIGYDTYHKILDETISELKEAEYKDLYADETLKEDRDFARECQIEADEEMLIPDDYVKSINERLALYTELNLIKDEGGISRFKLQLQDRFGKIPKQVLELFEGVRLKWVAKKLGIERIIIKNKVMRCYFIQNTESVFYQSNQFSKVLAYVSAYPVNLSMKQTDQYLILEFKHMDKIKTAKEKLEHVLDLKM